MSQSQNHLHIRCPLVGWPHFKWPNNKQHKTHIAYQQAMSQAHIAYLQAAQGAFSGLTGVSVPNLEMQQQASPIQKLLLFLQHLHSPHPDKNISGDAEPIQQRLIESLDL